MKAALSLIVAAGALAAALAAPAAAQPQRHIRQVVIYGTDHCPRSASGDDMTVESTVIVQHGYSMPGARTYGSSKDVFTRAKR